VVAAGVGVVRLLAALMQPYMPATSAKVLAMLGLPPSAAELREELVAGVARPQGLVAAGAALAPVELLFRTISDDTIAELRARWVSAVRGKGAALLWEACPCADLA
jgi:methionyl-tRNA synthetase